MNAQKYTQKSLEAIQAAQQLTIEIRTSRSSRSICSRALRRKTAFAPQLCGRWADGGESDAAVLQELGKPRV